MQFEGSTNFDLARRNLSVKTSPYIEDVFAHGTSNPTWDFGPKIYPRLLDVRKMFSI